MKKKLLLVILVVILAGLACRFDRVLNPALPTFTPTADPAEPVIPTVTPTPTPIPTPLPGARIESGDAAFFIGDWDQAVQEYALALNTASVNAVKSAAMLGLGRTYIKMEQYDAALDTLTAAIDGYPESPSRGELYFALGELYEILGQPADAINAFQEYLNLRPGLIEAHVYERIGENYLALGNYQQEIDAYSSSLDAAGGGNIYLNVRIGDAYYELGEHATALVTYEDVFNRTTNDYIKAEVKRKIGDIQLLQGNNEEAFQTYAEVVENYPLAYDAYLSLVALIDNGVAVSNLDRGLINYFVGQNGFAVDAFVRYLRDEATDEDADTALYYLGLAYLNLSNYDAAISTWQQLIDEHVNAGYWAAAFDEIAYTQHVYLEDPEAAIETYLAFVDRSPLDEKSPEFLYYAARIAERDFDLDYAARLWERVGTQFSTSSLAYDSLFQAGIARYRLREYDNAISLFQSALGIAGAGGETAGAYFWIGKCYQAAGNNTAAQESWLQASTSDPTGYYSERAEDLMANRDPFTPAANYDFNIDLEAEKGIAIEWMYAIFEIPTTEDLNDFTPIFSDPRVVRGTEFWNLGLYEEARNQFDSYRLDIQSDPANTFRLANYLIELGVYRSGIIAARQVLNLAGLDDAGTFTAPVYFNHLRFGLYYPELVFAAANDYNFDPLFLYSVLRQESLFESFVTSTANAYGLMQIIPSTGQEIANFLDWPVGYSEDDLFRPYVNIQFGASYLARQRNAFGGDLYEALAAYNGGAGNALIWTDLSNGDPDLLVEVIRFSETRNYIKYISELFDIYRNLYGVE